LELNIRQMLNRDLERGRRHVLNLFGVEGQAKPPGPVR
jgi:hypothetical protein